MLLDLVKETLRITWDTDDDYLKEIIGRAKANLNELIGVELVYEKEGLAQTLFLNYCRYEYNNAVEYFEENFHKEILRLQISEASKEGGTDDSR